MQVAIENLNVDYGLVRAVKELNLTVGESELLALLGPSGCGKSTTLLALGGFEQPASGRILFGAREVTQMPPRKRNVGICFQSYALYPTKSVRENIGFPLRMRGEATGAIERQVGEAAAMLELGALLDRMPSALSGGQQQRVALARALVKRPDLLLLDEPLSNLDARLRVSTRAQIKEVQQRLGIPTILVTHDQLEAMSIADRIGIMRDGNLEQIGTAQDCYHHPRSLFVASFIGTHPINLLDGVFEIDGTLRIDAEVPVVLDALDVRQEMRGGRVKAGIRPEYITIGDEGDLQANVLLVEPLGKEHLVTCSTPAGIMRAVVDESRSPTVGNVLWLTLPRRSIMLFDARTELSLRSTETAQGN